MRLVMVLSVILMVIICLSGCESASGGIATVTRMWVVPRMTSGHVPYYLLVELRPTDSAQANKQYTVDLYEQNILRDSTKVSWNQAELNVHTEKSVRYPMSEAEGDAYLFRDVSHIFSIKVYIPAVATPRRTYTPRIPVITPLPTSMPTPTPIPTPIIECEDHDLTIEPPLLGRTSWGIKYGWTLEVGDRIEGFIQIIGGDKDLLFSIANANGDIIFDAGVIIDEYEFNYEIINAGMHELFFNNGIPDTAAKQIHFTVCFIKPIVK